MKVQEHAKALLEDISHEIDATPVLNDKARPKLKARCGTRAFLKSVIDLTKSIPTIESETDEFDLKLNLFNLLNGTLNLDTGEIIDHDPAHKLTKRGGVVFDPDADCPIFRKFLDDILPKEIQAFLLRFFGYALTGTGKEQVFVVFVGSGSNGKTTLLRAIRDVLGDYSVNVEPTSLVRDRSGTINNDIARLKGARFVETTEFENGAVLNVALIKKLTGGDTITARFLHQEYFEFTLRAPLVVASNTVPAFDGGDGGIARRIIVVPFDATIPETSLDRTLSDKLKAEGPGILNLILDSHRQYVQDGLCIPKTIRDYTEWCINDHDLVGQFIEERCRVGEEEVEAAVLYDAYCVFCGNNRVKPLSTPTFRREILKKGYDQMRRGGGKYWSGISLDSTKHNKY